MAPDTVAGWCQCKTHIRLFPVKPEKFEIFSCKSKVYAKFFSFQVKHDVQAEAASARVRGVGGE